MGGAAGKNKNPKKGNEVKPKPSESKNKAKPDKASTKGGKDKDKKKKSKWKCCRPGVCRCWYCCISCLPIFWIWGCLLVALGLYCGITFMLNIPVAERSWQLHLIFWMTLGYGVTFVLIVQISYFLILYESIRICGTCIVLYYFGNFSILFILSFLGAFVCLIFTIVCIQFCPKPVAYLATNAVQVNTDVAHTELCVRACMFAAAATLACLVFVLHIYLYYVMQFKEDKAIEKELKDAETGSKRSKSSTTTKKSKGNTSLKSKSSKASSTNNNDDKEKGPNASQTPDQKRADASSPGPPGKGSSGGGPYKEDMPKHVKLFYFNI